MTPARRVRLLLTEVGPWLLCVVSLGLAWLLLKGPGVSGPVMAVAEARSWKIAPSELGRVSQVLVVEGGEVQAGDTLLQLDTSTLDGEIAIREAEEAQILAEGLALDEEGRRQSLLDRVDLSRTVDQLALEIAREGESLSTLRTELQAVSAERDRLKMAILQHLATAEELAATEQKFQTLSQEVASKPETLAVLQNQLDEARARQQAAQDPTAHLTPLERKVDVLHRQLDVLRQRRDALTLRAPASARVAKISVAAGEVISAGGVSIELVEATTRRVNACLPEVLATRPVMGDLAILSPVSGGNLLRGRIVMVSPRIEQLPQRCWRVQTVPVWGRLVGIELDEGQSLLPGQSLQVEVEFHSHPPADTGAALAQITAPTSEGTPLKGTPPREEPLKTLEIPEELGALSRVEPSGWLWLADRGRYLVVSDDTGLASADEHPPWLFTASADGHFDPRIVPIEGATELNDLESITTGPDSSIYLLSSQSVSKKGKRPTSRTLFTRILPTNTGWKSTGSTSFFDALSRWSPDRLAALGLSDIQGLEIEGMTRIGEDLLLGLKGPLTSDGQALVWRLSHPERLLSTGEILPEDLTLWARASLPAEVGGASTPGGISELLALPSGGLLVTSTPAQGSESETGCLSFWADNTTPPVKIQCFAGARPEGLSLGSRPGTVAIVFDDAPPRWVELPWPR